MAADIVVCWDCGWENDADDEMCERCGIVLRLETSAIQEQDDVRSTPSWGTKSFQSTLLLHIRGENQPIEIPVQDGEEIIIGRQDPVSGVSPEVDLSSLGGAAASVSRKHLVLTCEQGLLRIADLGSANNTYLNGQKLPVGQLRVVRSDDEIRLGHLVMTISFPNDQQT